MSVCTYAGVVCEERMQYYNYIIIAVEVLMYTVLRYGSIQMTAIIIIAPKSKSSSTQKSETERGRSRMLVQNQQTKELTD